jgi:hypothetical protein
MSSQNANPCSCLRIQFASLQGSDDLIYRGDIHSSPPFLSVAADTQHFADGIVVDGAVVARGAPQKRQGFPRPAIPALALDGRPVFLWRGRLPYGSHCYREKVFPFHARAG